MSGTLIFWPVIVTALIAFALYGLLSSRRVAAVKGRRASVEQFRANVSEPQESLFVHNALRNQFELPVLFYVAVIALHVTGGDGRIALALAWVFALSRVAHAYEHVTKNRVLVRRQLFIVGMAAALGLWLLLIVRLATT